MNMRLGVSIQVNLPVRRCCDAAGREESREALEYHCRRRRGVGRDTVLCFFVARKKSMSVQGVGATCESVSLVKLYSIDTKKANMVWLSSTIAMDTVISMAKEW